jgi:hypothetical protein
VGYVVDHGLCLVHKNSDYQHSYLPFFILVNLNDVIRHDDVINILKSIR